MAEYAKYLYSIMHPNYALVGSMLPPAEFGKHYTIGSSRFFRGQVIFAEIDIKFRHEYFPIDRFLEELTPKPDGTPKRTKFIKTYRVLEHLNLAMFKDLYVTSPAGKVLRLEKKPYGKPHEPGWLRTFQEICPFSMIVLTYMTPPEFGRYITDPEQPKGAPKVMFTQIEFNTKEFLRDIEEHPFLGSPLPNVHAHKLRDQIQQLMNNPHKKLKGISLDSALNEVSFLRLRTGFWIAAQEELLFYPIPDKATIQKEHFDWLRSIEQ
jgi:hypothetical protein